MAKSANTKNIVKYYVYLVRNKITGGRFVSVRKVDARIFRRVLEAGMNDPNFDMPVLRSFRQFGSEAHTITALKEFTDRKDALAFQTPLIEENARKGLSLNASRPKIGRKDPDFAWEPKDYVTPAQKRANEILAGKVRAKRTMKVAMRPKINKPETSNPESKDIAA